MTEENKPTATPPAVTCGYCASPQHFTPASGLPNQEGLWHRSELGGHYRCTAPAVTEPWHDEGGHAWEVRHNVTCVECPHCCFVFAAVHTDGYSNGYSCPNCEGCPDAAVTEAGEQERRICACGHPRIDHRFYSDHDECLACGPVEGADNDGLCCEFRAAPPSTSAAIDSAVREIVDMDINGRYDPRDPNSRKALAAILSRWFGKGETEQENKNA